MCVGPLLNILHIVRGFTSGLGEEADAFITSQKPGQIPGSYPWSSMEGMLHSVLQPNARY